MKLKSALGISNITYKLIKQWKIVQIYTIPKNNDWGSILEGLDQLHY
ncbi:82_t:CDS:2 [Gigaspora margarita]|uniref:82_t:CDS:1 n=1 Tax=Gigaspora margarita TaxID=4874 RepID=A0ABM8W177_GIGMA|nr:82_t:CDS:2 [Gigaspora margarita]